MNKDFYNKNVDFMYPEIAICLEDTEGPTAKIFIPIATPLLSKNIAYNNKNLVKPTTNIVSDASTMYIDACTESNYIEMKLPDDKPAKKGDKFIVIFIGGDVNRGVLTGRYNE